jgi:hypothetical protein
VRARCAERMTPDAIFEFWFGDALQSAAAARE